MKTIIAGSRDIINFQTVESAIQESGFNISEVVSGLARGVDTLAILYCKKYNLPWMEFPAEWDKHGKSAGYIRNQQMADYADALIAVWDGESRGTKHMIDIANKQGLKVYIKIV